MYTDAPFLHLIATALLATSHFLDSASLCLIYPNYILYTVTTTPPVVFGHSLPELSAFLPLTR